MDETAVLASAFRQACRGMMMGLGWAAHKETVDSKKGDEEDGNIEWARSAPCKPGQPSVLLGHDPGPMHGDV